MAIKVSSRGATPAEGTEPQMAEMSDESSVEQPARKMVESWAAQAVASKEEKTVVTSAEIMDLH